MGGQSFEYADLKGDFFAGRAKTNDDNGLMNFSKKESDRHRFRCLLYTSFRRPAASHVGGVHNVHIGAGERVNLSPALYVPYIPGLDLYKRQPLNAAA